MEVNDLLEANLEGLRKVFGYYFDPRKKFMSQQEAMNLMMKDSRLFMLEKEASYCYGMCKMTVALESEESSVKYRRLVFVEFLELVGRIADLKCKGTELERLPLAKKIEFVLDDLFELVNFQRRDVNIIIDDQSESDDEY